MNPKLQTCRIAVLAMAGTVARGAEPIPEFNKDIRPILSDRCFTCHGFDAKAREADLRLDLAAAAYEDRKGGAAFVAGKPEKSQAWQRILSTDPDEVMPPADSHLKLDAAEKDLIRRWIEGGAVYQAHWTLQRIERPAVAEGGHPVDAIIAKRLAKEGLQMSPEAAKETVARRLSFDLRGLPPSPEELQAFTSDPAPDAYEKMVDRFLADPAYGERMAWPWLDAARYADSNGYQGDADRTMWPWRDWVISAFNRNLPYDQFTVWQIAGDLLPDATQEQILATGFLRNHPINGEGGSIPEENRVNYAMDMAETTGTVWMGLTMNCCRCHDHKYDALKQRDYYSLLAFFNQTPVDGSGGDPQTAPVIAAPSPEQRQKEEQLAGELKERDAKLAAIAVALAAEQPEWEAAQLAREAPEIWTTLTPERVDGTESEVLEDRSVLTSGANPANATYIVRAAVSPGSLTTVKLEALRHPSMTAGGIARSDSGNFVLTGFEAVLINGSERRRLEIARAEATYEQGGVFKIDGALDDDPRSGWAVYEGRPVDRDHAAVFHLAQAVDVPAGAVLEFTLRHDSPHVSHNLGRFRLAVSGDVSASLEHKDLSAMRHVLRIPAAERTPAQAKLVRETQQKDHSEFNAETAKRRALDGQLTALRKEMPKVMVMADRQQRRATHVLAVGSYDKPLEQVEAGTPGILPPLAKGEGPANRLDLAKWLVAREHPLTSRVTVNRLWQEYFGIGLIKTPEDFGVQSEVPVYPELLDWLAADFMESGWDLKRLVRMIVTSKAYRQSSRVTPELLEKDPANRLLARGPRFRLPAWMIRDQALAAGGLMVKQMGGAPVKPYSPANLWPDATFGRVQYVRDKGGALHRRSLYTFWRRISAPPMFFDNAKREVCTVNPSRTNTPLHALSTLNDTTFVEAARALASRAVWEGGSEAEARLSRAFLIVNSRKPDAEEAMILLEMYMAARVGFAAEPGSAEAFLKNGELAVDGTLAPIEEAALASVCLSILNTDEALTKE